MKRTAMKPGKGFAPRATPMARGSRTLATKTPMKRTTALQAVAVADRESSTVPKFTRMASVGARAKRTGQGKVAPTAQEAAWMARAQAFGCIVCYLYHDGARTPAAIHHIISGGRRMGHLHTLPLCDPGHHQNSPTKEKIARHPDKARFVATYGTEEELLAQLASMLGENN